MENKPAIVRENPIAQTSKESIERVQSVMKDILEGIPNAVIIDKYSELWNIKPMSIYPYIQQCVIEMSHWREKDRDAIIDEVYNRYMLLYQKAIKKNNEKLGLEILNSIVKLLGIQAPQQIAIDTTSRIINIHIAPPENDQF